MGNSHKNLLLRNHWANCNQTFVEWSLDGPLPKLCPVILTSNQDGHIQWLFHQNFVLIEQMVSDKKIFMGISHRVLCWIKFGCGGHLGRCSEMPDTIWKRTTQESFQPPQPNLIQHRTLWEIPIKIFLSETICSIRTKFWWNSHWMVLFQKCVRQFGPSIKGGHLGRCSEMPDTIWKRTTQESFQQSLVEISSVVSEEKIF
jgi:hypothetical protein